MKVNFFRVTTGTMFATIATATSLRQALDSAMAETTMPDLFLSQVDSTADTEASLLGATSPMMSLDWGFDSMGQHLAQTDNLAEANKKNPPKSEERWLEEEIYGGDPITWEPKPKEVEIREVRAIRIAPERTVHFYKRGDWRLEAPTKSELKAKQQKISAKQKQIDLLKSKLAKVTGKEKVKIQSDIKKAQSDLSTLKKELATMNSV